MNEELLKYIYYYQLSVFQRFVYDYFMKHVYPDIKKAHISHLRLLDEGHIAHVIGAKKMCTTCKFRDLLIPNPTKGA